MQYFIFVIVLVVPLPIFADDDYYWQDYNGTVPDDAIEGGYDADGNSIFIGQAKIDKSSIPVPIYPNKSDVIAPQYSPNVWKSAHLTPIKILCSHSPPVDWFRGNAEHLHVQAIENAPVVGGKVDSLGTVHIGRVFYENEMRLGPVLSYDLNEAVLIFAHNNEIRKTGYYEILGRRREMRPRRPFRRGPGGPGRPVGPRRQSH